MTTPKFLSSAIPFAFVAVLALATGCNIDVKKNPQGEEKKVDINTPIGAVHVSKDVDVHDIGLPVYPGARPVEHLAQGEEKSANVNISTSWFGLKVVAQEFESNDSSDKLLSYYSRELKKYGNSILRCQTKWHGGDVQVHASPSENPPDRKDPHQLTCDNEHGDTVELKVGTKENQHIVAIEPQGNGAKFALVYVQVRDKEGMI